jgi:hypothetical protein
MRIATFLLINQHDWTDIDEVMARQTLALNPIIAASIFAKP